MIEQADNTTNWPEPAAKQAPPVSRQELMRLITATCAAYFGVTVEDVLSRAKPNKVSMARHCAICFSVDFTDQTKSDIARFFGRDHKVVSHAIGAIEGRFASSDAFKGELRSLRDAVNEAVRVARAG